MKKALKLLSTTVAIAAAFPTIAQEVKDPEEREPAEQSSGGWTELHLELEDSFDFSKPEGIAFDLGSGNLFIADGSSSSTKLRRQGRRFPPLPPV